MKKAHIEAELKSLPVGKTRMIAWEAVTRWTSETFEIGTWGKKTSNLEDTVATLCAVTEGGR